MHKSAVFNFRVRFMMRLNRRLMERARLHSSKLQVLDVKQTKMVFCLCCHICICVGDCMYVCITRICTKTNFNSLVYIDNEVIFFWTIYKSRMDFWSFTSLPESYLSPSVPTAEVQFVHQSIQVT